MVDSVNQNESTPVDEKQAQQLTLLVYILLSLGFFTGGVTWIAAVVINHVKQDSLIGSWYASHFRWQMRTFWFGVLWYAITAPLFLIVVGWFAWCGITIWVVYRIVRGWLAFNENRAMYV